MDCGIFGVLAALFLGLRSQEQLPGINMSVMPDAAELSNRLRQALVLQLLSAEFVL